MDTGKQTAPYCDMGSLPCAALDPVFYAHHGNIDKVWAWRQALHGDQTPASINPATGKAWDPAWASNTWQFHDYNGKCYSITAADVVDYTKNLRYSYPIAPGLLRLIPIPIVLEASALHLPNPPEQLTEANVVTLQLDGVEVPSPASGRFNLVAKVNGTMRRIGSFAIFAHPMPMSLKTNVLARIDAEAVPVLRAGKTEVRIVPEQSGERLGAFSVLSAAHAPASELRASSATLFTE